MMQSFVMIDLGLLSYFLGLEVKQMSDGVFITQRRYVKDLVKHLNMENCKALTKPMSTGDNL